jgi:hypothetical protein
MDVLKEIGAWLGIIASALLGTVFIIVIALMGTPIGWILLIWYLWYS